MDYNIGIVSKLLGISIEGIRNYEKSGLVKSKRDVGSNYRKYSYLDITSLIRTKSYRSLGFSINETLQLTNDASINTILEMLLEKKCILSAEEEILQEKMRYIHSLFEQMTVLEQQIDKVRIEDRHACYWLKFSKNGEILFDDERVELFRKWMNHTPFVFISSKYSEDGNVYGGLTISAQHVSAGVFDDALVHSGLVDYLPTVQCITLTVRENGNDHADIRLTAPLLEYAQKHNFSISPDFFGKNIISINKSTNYTRYRKIYAELLSEE